jgi:hypothetical protein
MSLGFNTMRNPRTTNLPGGVNGSVIFSMPRTVKSPRGNPPVKKPLENKSLPSPLNKAVVAVAENTTETDESQHSVYATVKDRLLDVTGENVFEDKARVLMVYPMRKETNENVSMRVKMVNEITGQLSYKWVVVFDPSTDERFLTDFSLIP